MHRIIIGLSAATALLLATASSASAGDFYFGISSGGYGGPSYYGRYASPYHGVHRHVVPSPYYRAPRVHYGHSVYAPRGYYSSRPLIHSRVHRHYPGHLGHGRPHSRIHHGRLGHHY